MKANEVNLKGLQEINIEQELESVVPGSGTYADIEEAVNNKVISLLTDNFGNVVGISCNSGKTGIEDAIEGMKFEKRFYGHDVLAYVYKALTGKDIYEDEFGDIDMMKKIYIDDGVDFDDIDIDDEEDFNDAFDEEDFDDALPTRLELDVEWLTGDINEKSIAKFLREEFGHYLSGKEKPFNFQYNEGDNYVEVTDIKWGRKKY